MNVKLICLQETKRVVSMILKHNKQQIGIVRFSPPCPKTHHSTAFLNNISVNKEYQNRKIGSSLLKIMNNYLEKKTEATHVSGLLWDGRENHFLSEFFKKNGYSMEEDKIMYHDDGETIFEITPIERKLQK